MYGANNYGYNPYGTYIPQRQMQQPLQQPLQTAENSAQLFNAVQSCSGLKGKQVDSIDVARTIDYPLDGTASYFPLIDGSAIVVKQLGMDGAGKITVFKPVTDAKEPVQKYATIDDIESAISKIDIPDIDDIKDDIKELRQDIKDLRKTKGKINNE